MEDNKVMDIEEHHLDEDVLSCSSSILNTPRNERQMDDYASDSDDDVNVTLLSRPQIDIKTTLPRQDLTGTKLGTDSIKPLSGAGKKRYRRLIDSGINQEEARRLAALPLLTPNSDPGKRFRNSESNSSGENPRPKKQGRPMTSRGNVNRKSIQHRLDQIRAGPSGTMTKPSYRDVVNSVKVGIIPKDYPNSELTMQQLIATQKAVLGKVLHQRKERVKPKFGNCLFRPGYLILICKNQETSDWLKNIISSIIPSVGVDIVAVDEHQIPQPETLIGFFPMSVEDSNEDILALLDAQNEGLVVDSWKIFVRKIINKRHVELTFSVDGVSMRSLNECNFVLDFKFGSAPIRKKNPKKTKTERMETDDTEAIRINRNICETGNVKMIGTNTNHDVPGPSGIQNSVRTSSNTTEVNSIKRTPDGTGDEKKVPGTSGGQNTGRTQSKQTYRKIDILAGNSDCGVLLGNE
ncbi:uncharacterized protein LOC128745277 [Sabethes cyaneus]|uniref:uncharacterized protein LOC128743268 n=1 Tax=Sabethes cyaneus TaxID=53552 RepID=UPI00237E995D|nr:uncharacterized protein LOC128743268 [Sabethes cyaneus]XP_053698284.1 uncharacterized protein LOC128745277 [Sabethes cyaneus]